MSENCVESPIVAATTAPHLERVCLHRLKSGYGNKVVGEGRFAAKQLREVDSSYCCRFRELTSTGLGCGDRSGLLRDVI